MEESVLKKCTTCSKEYELSHFMGMKHQITKTCSKCRETNKIRDAKRDKTHRNEVARKNESKPERKQVKQAWNEANHDKVVLKLMNYRQRKIEHVGIDQYLKENAEQASKWRENNKEKVDVLNKLRKQSKKIQYGVYKRCANTKNLDFKLSFEQYKSLVDQKCYYCNGTEEKGFNGIDRNDQTKGYTIDNCLPCCTMCNYIKGSLHSSGFIKRIEHILTHQGRIQGEYHAEYFADHKGCSYSGYKKRAETKQLDFHLTQDEFLQIRSEVCYLCGKMNTDTHVNGLDRLDSTKGYTIDNVKSCCGECNYMKKKYLIDELLDHLYAVHTHCGSIQLATNNVPLQNKMIVCNDRKKTHAQMNEESEQRKEINKNALIEKYNNEEYKQNRATMLAQKRAMQSP
jgi:hypothetical protein